MPPAAFEPAILASEQQHAHALDLPGYWNRFHSRCIAANCGEQTGTIPAVGSVCVCVCVSEREREIQVVN